MTNPPYILEHLDAIARVLNHPRVYAFLHIPVQVEKFTHNFADENRLETMKCWIK